jgi:hypothetical protein
MVFTLILMASMAVAPVAATQAEPEVWVGATVPGERGVFVEDEPLVGGPEDELLLAETWAGYKCKEYRHGCPRGTVIMSGGNIKGCAGGVPGTTCTGTCTACSGGNVAAALCERAPGSSCTLASGGGLVTCGTKGASTCGFAAPPSLLSDPRGCMCPLPLTFSEDPCRIQQCLAEF